MGDVARRLLERLLRRSESAKARNAERASGIRLTESTAAAYFALPTAKAKAIEHGYLLGAERAGAVELEWDRRAGEHGQVAWMRVRDPHALARYLDVIPHWEALEHARTVLLPLSRDGLDIPYFLRHWEQRKTVRGLGPEDVDRVVDAVRVLAALSSERDSIMRKLSVRLFGDSKRIEALVPCLDVLTASDPAVVRDSHEVLASLGILTSVNLLHMCGSSSITTTSGLSYECSAHAIGLPPDVVAGLGARPPRFILSVEGHSSFYELARNDVPDSGLVVLSSGMPSPAWRRAYAAIVSSSPTDTRLFHWGDLDVGGMRIASVMHADLRKLGRSLNPHLMDPARLSSAELSSARAATVDTIQRMCRIAASMGWSALAENIARCKITIEQEALVASLPTY